MVQLRASRAFLIGGLVVFLADAAAGAKAPRSDDLVVQQLCHICNDKERDRIREEEHERSPLSFKSLVKLLSGSKLLVKRTHRSAVQGLS